MSLQTSREASRKSTPAIDSDRWPAVAKVPSGPVSAASAVIRRPAFAPRRRPPAAAIGLSRRDSDRCRRPFGADAGDPPARRVGTADRTARADRVRRVLHGRRMVLERPHAGPDGVRQLSGRSGARDAAMAAPDCPGLPPALAKRQPRSVAAQHRRALRLIERPVRRVPRRNHDVLMRAVQRAAGIFVRLGRSAATQNRPAAGYGAASGRAAGCSKSAPAGANCASARPPAEHTSAR